MSSQTTPLDLVPSPSYSFEPEFTGHPPRAIPDRLGEGPHARPEHLMALRGRPVTAHVREGRFGWPWVETVAPR